MLDRFIDFTRSRRSPVALFLASVAESTLVPVPIELVMTPMMVADRARNWVFASAVFLGCIAGSLAMYGVGFLLFETVGRPLVETFGWQDAYESFRQYMEEDGPLAVAAISITPIPLVVAAIGAGAGGMNVLLFIAVLGATRAVRYFGIALLVSLLGERAERLLERYRESRAVQVAVWAGTFALVVALVFLSGGAVFDGDGGSGGSGG